MSDFDEPNIKVGELENKGIFVLKEQKYTEAELKKMNAHQQIAILRNMGVKKIPSLEKEKIDLIMKGGNK